MILKVIILVHSCKTSVKNITICLKLPWFPLLYTVKFNFSLDNALYYGQWLKYNPEIFAVSIDIDQNMNS